MDPLPAPIDEEIARILEHIHGRVIALLRRRGRLPEEPGATDPVADQIPLLAGYAAASVQELIAAGPRAGHPVRRLRRRRSGGAPTAWLHKEIADLLTTLRAPPRSQTR